MPHKQLFLWAIPHIEMVKAGLGTLDGKLTASIVKQMFYQCKSKNMKNYYSRNP